MNKILCFILIFFACSFCNAEIVQDDIAAKLPKDSARPQVYKNYNFEPTEKIPIEIKVINPIKTEAELYEGQIIDFKVAKDVLYNDKLFLKRGTPVTAKISVVIEPGMNGIPASVILKDFKIENLAKSKLSDSYEIFGQDRSLLVFPLKWMLTVVPPTGSLTNFIRGGHVKLKPKELVTVYYYPNWK